MPCTKLRSESKHTQERPRKWQVTGTDRTASRLHATATPRMTASTTLRLTESVALKEELFGTAHYVSFSADYLETNLLAAEGKCIIFWSLYLVLITSISLLECADSSTMLHHVKADILVRNCLITGFCHQSLGTMRIAKEVSGMKEVAKQEMKPVLTINRKWCNGCETGYDAKWRG